MGYLLKWAIIAVLALVIIFLAIKYDERKRKKLTEGLFEGRTPLSKEEFYRTFYSETDISEDVVVKVLNILEERLNCDFSQLKKTDSFSSNLRFFLYEDEWAGDEIVMSLEEDFFIQISGEEAENTHTIDDIIQLVWSKVQAA